MVRRILAPRLLSIVCAVAAFGCSGDTIKLPGLQSDGAVTPGADGSATASDGAVVPGADGGVTPTGDAGEGGTTDGATPPPIPDSGPPGPREDGGEPPRVDSGVPTIPDTGVSMGPDLLLSWIGGFTTTATPGTTVTLRFRVDNLGSTDAPATDVTVQLTEVASSMSTLLTSLPIRALAVGEGEQLTAMAVLPPRLVPGDYEVSAMVDIANSIAEENESNNRASRTVAILGPLRVTPATIDFGTIGTGCRSDPRTVTVSNQGAVAETLSTVALSGATTAEFLPEMLMLPQVLQPTDSVDIDLRYAPMDVGMDTAQLVLGFPMSAQGNLTVQLSGDGSQAPRVTEFFTQTGTSAVDFLFVVDNSCSMSEEQRILGSQFTGFAQYAQSRGLNYRIAVTTTDVTSRGAADGRFVGNPRIIDPSTPDAARVFQQNVSLGTNGSGDERGIEASLLALTAPLINTDNANFLRASAALGIVYVSDEDDHTREQISQLETRVLGLKPVGQLKVNAIVGTQRPSCNGQGGRATYGGRYLALVQATNGHSESICTGNYLNAFTTIIDNVGPRRSYMLGQAPQGMTIQVTVNSVPSTAWTFDGMQSITFDPMAVPPPGATIRVSYVPSCN